MHVRSAALILVMLLPGWGSAQSPPPARKPVRNPPQYPHIIDLSGTEATQGSQDPAKAATKATEKVDAQPDAQTEGVLRALEALTTEMRSLVNEIRVMNLRQQTQIEMTRLASLASRADGLSQNLRTVRDRLAAVRIDEQNLLQLMTRESLLSQSYNIGTLDREKTMEQIRLNHEFRLRQVQAERDQLQRTEQDLLGQIESFKAQQEEVEKRLQQSEDQLRRLGDSREPPTPTPAP
jgi:chromosome segregation ATPase